MHSARFNCGISLSYDKKRIYVVGGHNAQDKITKSTEVYDIAADQWKRLPDISAAKYSPGVCEFSTRDGKKWLFCFGGIIKPESSEPQLVADVERLSLNQETATWETLNYKLPNPMCELCSFQVTANQILIGGGYSKSTFDDFVSDEYIVSEGSQKARMTNKVFLCEVSEKDLKETRTGTLGSSDIFICPVMSIVGKMVMFSGHHKIHKMDAPSFKFETGRY